MKLELQDQTAKQKVIDDLKMKLAKLQKELAEKSGVENNLKAANATIA